MYAEEGMHVYVWVDIVISSSLKLLVETRIDKILYYTTAYRQLKLPLLIPVPILVFTHFLCLSASLLFSTTLAISVRK